MTNPTVLRPIILLPTAMPTDHAIRPLIVMFLSLIMAFIARVNLLAAAEAKPSVGLRVVATAAFLGQFGAGDEAECLFLAAGLSGWRQVRGADAEEFDLRDEEGEFLMAFATDVRCCLAAGGDDSW